MEEYNPGFEKNNKYVEVLEVIKKVNETVDIQDAKILVSGGRGVEALRTSSFCTIWQMPSAEP